MKATRGVAARGAKGSQPVREGETRPACDMAEARWRDLCGILAPACFFAWVYVTCFSQVFQGGPFDAGRNGWHVAQQMLMLAGYLTVIAARVLRDFDARAVTSARVVGWSIAGTAATAVTAVAFMLPHDTLGFALVVACSYVAGLGAGAVQVQWMHQYATHGAKRAIWEWPLVLMAVAVIAAVAMLLPRFADIVMVSLLPLAAGLFVDRFGFVGEPAAPAADDAPAPDLPHALPIGMVAGVTAMGFVYGMTQHFALEYEHGNPMIAFDCFAVSALVGCLLFLYARATRHNFGLSSWTLIIIPLAGFAQCLVAVHRTDLLITSFFFMQVAYLLLDAVLWMQLPCVYQRLGTIKRFLQARLLYEGSLGLGFIAQFVLALTGFTYFDIVSSACMFLLLVALTLSFSGDNAATVWSLMPQPEQFTGKFRRACHGIEAAYGLTKRESEILELVMRGRSGPYIQDKLVISKNTYQTHMRNVYTKLDIHSQQDLLDLLERTIDEQKDQDPSLRLETARR